MSDNQYTGASAHLTVALPHARLGNFEQELFVPVAGEGSGAAQVHSRSTTAENVTQEASETQKKLTQLTAYRDRLVAMEKRPNISVSDSLRIESELAKVLGDLEAAKSQQMDVANRVAKERLSISLLERPGFSDAFRPVGRVWKDGVHLFGDSTASALQFLIQLIPWLPLVAGGFFLVRWLWRVSRRQRPNAPSSQNSA
jgi:hypothetical protein